MNVARIVRVGVAGATLTAAGLGAWLQFEGWSDRAIQPVKNDKWTIGPGLTTRPDGSAVQPGDTVTVAQGVRRAIVDLSAKEATLRACLGEGTNLYPHEWDALVSLSGNVGAAAVCKSSIIAKAKRGDYAAACKTILDFRRVQGRDCSLPANKRFCGGVWTRRRQEYRMCAEGVYP